MALFHEILVVVSVANVSLMFSYVFCYVSYFNSCSFPVKFSELDKVEFNFITLAVGKFHVHCSSSVEKDSCTYALFTFLNNLSIPRYPELNCYTFCLSYLTK